MSKGSGGHRPGRLPSISRSLQLLAGVLLVMILGATAHRLLVARAGLIAGAEEQMTRLDMVFAEQTGRAVETVDFILRNAIDTLRDLQAKPPLDRAAFEEVLRRRIEGVRQVAEIAFVGERGRVLFSSRPGASGSLPPAAQKMLRALAADPHAGLKFSDPLRGPDGRWTALMLRRVANPDGSFAGAAVAYLNLPYFTDFYRAVELNEDGAILLHLRDGTVLARYPDNDAVVGRSYADLPPFKDILAHRIAGTVIMPSPVSGQLRILAIRALKLFPLAVNVSVEESRVLAPWRRQAWTFSLIAAAASASIVGLMLLLAQRSRQIEALLGEYRAAKEAAEEAHGRLLEQMAERERAEAALRQAQRIEAVGQLTGGVAHDFNNLLTVMTGNIELIEAAPGLDPATAERLAAMRAAAERGAMLTDRLLAFARRQPLVPRAVDVNGLIAGMRDLLESALGARVRMEMELAADLWPAMVDPTQIELVILNLAINGRDAMPAGGVLTIETQNRRRGPPSRPEEPTEGDYVMVSVRDTGTGMPPEVQARAFEPFFTTKAPGAGTGLGLSQVFGTARQSGGDVQIDSAPGQGTTVSVFLPRTSAAVEEPAPNAPEGAEAQASRALVLAVDDDEAVRGTTAAILKSLGYRVVEAASGEAALDILTREHGIDLLLTDVVMPGISGVELARKARAAAPGLPIVFISGFADPAGSVGSPPLRRLVKKPFHPADLRQQIEGALAERRPPA
ncbi:MAG TPA: ATP-binding protein [Stellaceae bacterium]|nr:ATP-binding protein [Stellaceae bacterium]